MSDDDFTFDDDLFDDDDFDDFDALDDDGGGGAFDEFGGFDEFDNDADLDAGFDFPEDDVNLDDFEDPQDNNEGGSNRTFIIIAAIFVLILILGFGFLIFSVLGGGGTSELDVTRTAIADLNATTEAQLQATDQQATEFANLTATATLFTPTPTITPSPTLSPTPEVDIQATNIILTSDAAAAIASTNAAATVSADATIAASTSVAQAPTEATSEPVEDETISAPSLGAVQQTATALANLFAEQDVFATPTAGGSGTTALPTPISGNVSGNNNLPDTGLFDDLSEGGPGVMFLMAFGLIGLIAISRIVRGRNRK